MVWSQKRRDQHHVTLVNVGMKLHLQPVVPLVTQASTHEEILVSNVHKTVSLAEVHASALNVLLVLALIHLIQVLAQLVQSTSTVLMDIVYLVQPELIPLELELPNVSDVHADMN